MSQPVETPLLLKMETVQLPEVDEFVLTEEVLKKANVGYVGDNFKRLFFGIREENVGAGTIITHRLERNSLDAPILAELGDKARIHLAHFFGLLIKQSNGQSGFLLTDEGANIAYIIGNDGNFWVVCARWGPYNYNWAVFTESSVGDMDVWAAGDQIFSCDSY